MATVNELILRIRSDLDEAATGVGGQWSDLQLKQWMNAARSDLAVVTKKFETSVDVVVGAGNTEVTAPSSVIEIDHAYFLPDGDERVIPLRPSHFDAMDQVWGSWQNISSGDPQTFAPYGYSPNLKLRLYPGASRAGILRLYCSIQPVAIAEVNAVNNSTYDMPDMWTDAVVFYVCMRALRRDDNDDWQIFMNWYMEKREQLQMATHTSSTREMVYDYAAGGVPRHLADWNY